MKFKVEIEMGNDAVQDGGDVAWLLVEVSNRIKFTNDLIRGNIMDKNGNTVGFYKYEED